ncbi:biotin/lipoate A/B protein ligase family protein [Elusimicrobiota bacterium]
MRHTQWRFIDTGSNSGTYNMALDQALLNRYNPGSDLPVFRLYHWDPPAISLGRFQEAGSVLDLKKCLKNNIPVVRRLTGGGAIFHDHELTYSIICSADTAALLPVKESYGKLSSFLIHAYRELGYDACFANEIGNAGMRLGKKSDFCFAGREDYDILLDGKKIGGSAQKRTKYKIFQHGSIPMHLDPTGHADYFKDDITDTTNRITFISSRSSIGMPQLKKLLKKSFEKNLGVTLIPDGLKPEEEKTSLSLQENICVAT